VYNNNVKKMYLMRELAELISNEDSVDIHNVWQLCPVRILVTLTHSQGYAITAIYQDFTV